MFAVRVGWLELSYRQLPWIVQIVLLACAILHITATINSLCKRSVGATPETGPRSRLFRVP